MSWNVEWNVCWNVEWNGIASNLDRAVWLSMWACLSKCVVIQSINVTTIIFTWLNVATAAINYLCKMTTAASRAVFIAM